MLPNHLQSSTQRLRSVLVAAGALGVLGLATACSGGGKSDVIPHKQSTSATLLSGRSSKGILQNATVSAFEWVSGAWTKRGEVKTDTKGNFTLEMNGYTGKPVKLETTGSQMIWDGPSAGGHTFGSPETLAEGLSLKTVLPGAAGGNLTGIPVTPYTSMAAALFEAGTIKDAAAAQKAISTLNVLTGFDLASTQVVDLTDADAMAAATTSERRAAGMSAAVIFLPGQSLGAIVQGLAKSIEDGTFDSKDPVSIGSLTQAWLDASSHPTLGTRMGDAAAGELKVQAQTVNQASKNGVYAPVPPTNVPSGEVAKAKALIQDTRSLVSNILQTDFETPLGQAGKEYQAVADVFDRNANAIVDILNLAIRSGVQEVRDAEGLLKEVRDKGQAQRTILVKDGVSTLGTLILTLNDPSSVKINLKGALKGDARTVNVDVNLDTGLDSTKIDWNQGTTPQTNLRFTLQASVGDDTTALDISKGEVNLAWEQKADGSPILTKLDLTNLTLNLRTAKASFQGNATFESARILDSTPVVSVFHEMDRLSPKRIAFEGTFKLGDRSFRATVGLDLANAEAFDIQAFLEGGNVLWQNFYPTLSTKQIQAIKAISGIPPSEYYWEVFYGSGPWGSEGYANGWVLSASAVNALLRAYSPDTFMLEPYKNLPGTRVTSRNIRVQGYGASAYCSAGGGIELGRPQETAEHFLQFTANVGFELSGVAGLPTVKAQVSAKRTTLDGGTVVFGLNWGSRAYTFTFENVDVTKKNGTLTISNGQGTSLQLKDIAGASTDNATGVLYVGNTKVAEVKQVRKALKVTYLDGTFETLQ